MPSDLSTEFLGMEVKKKNEPSVVHPFKGQQSRQLANIAGIHSFTSGSDLTKLIGVRSQRNL